MATKRYREAVDAFLAAREAFTPASRSRRATRCRRSAGSTTRSGRFRTTSRGAAASSRAQHQSIQAAVPRNEDQIKTLQSCAAAAARGRCDAALAVFRARRRLFSYGGSRKLARAEYRAALKEKPDLGEGHLNLAVVCMLTGRLDEADSEVALAEKAGVKVPQGLKDEIQKRREANP